MQLGGQTQTDANRRKQCNVVEGETKDLLYQHSAYKKTPSLALRQNDGAGTEKRPKNELFQK
ncbi:MAG: hypothetical protein CBB70_11800 [Planctomycetaceae bacterium TMED10]|nr:MAG: hypothetical protein CBB70_11800 [Planctomycetaceae bacterium TMED10]|tara:strand:+ start:277 stop:462 length:186 start_codon:yes stop_codon:yes gene_type:complete